MPAGSRNARRRADRKPKPVGAAGTQAAIAWRIDHRAAQTPSPPEPLRLPAPLNQLPWAFAKDQFGPQRADFIGVMGALMIRFAKDQFRAYLIDPTRLSGTLPLPPRKTSSGLGQIGRAHARTPVTYA